MHETAEDISSLQLLLDESHAAGDSHLRGIMQQERRLSASELAEILTGVQILSLATVTKRCTPLVGGVDGLFYRAGGTSGRRPIRCAPGTSPTTRR